jgi:hypothetical protein
MRFNDIMSEIFAMIYELYLFIYLLYFFNHDYELLKSFLLKANRYIR